MKRRDHENNQNLTNTMRVEKKRSKSKSKNVKSFTKDVSNTVL